MKLSRFLLQLPLIAFTIVYTTPIVLRYPTTWLDLPDLMTGRMAKETCSCHFVEMLPLELCRARLKEYVDVPVRIQGEDSLEPQVISEILWSKRVAIFQKSDPQKGCALYSSGANLPQ